MEILRSKRVGFRRPKHFNDPFEFVLATVQPGYDAALIADQMKQLGDPAISEGWLRKALDWSQTMMASESVNMNCAVLCLSREPLNPLMWAHYAQLEGMVIGYDVSAPFFRGYNNACPIQFGDVIYSPDRPEPHKLTVNVPPLSNWYYQPFDEQNLATVRRVFLTKPARWQYENEIRIVKRLNDTSEDSIRHRIESPPGRELFLYNLPIAAVREVYRLFHPMRLHALKVHPGVGSGKEPAIFRDFVIKEVGARFFAVTADERSWEFVVEELTGSTSDRR